MDLWNSVINKKDIINNVVGKTINEIKSFIESKEKNYSFNSWDDRDYKNGDSKTWTVFINEYNLYDKIIHSFKLFFINDNCVKVEKRY